MSRGGLQVGGNFRGAWDSDTQYSRNDTVTNGGSLYSANVDHTSGQTFDATLWAEVSAGGASAPSPGGVVGRKPSGVRPQPLTTTGALIFAYEPRRYRVVIDNPTGSGNDIQIGYTLAKNRNAAGTYPTTVTPGQTFVSDTFYPYPLWARTALGTLTANVRQELVADR